MVTATQLIWGAVIHLIAIELSQVGDINTGRVSLRPHLRATLKECPFSLVACFTLASHVLWVACHKLSKVRHRSRFVVDHLQGWYLRAGESLSRGELKGTRSRLTIGSTVINRTHYIGGGYHEHARRYIEHSKSNGILCLTIHLRTAFNLNDPRSPCVLISATRLHSEWRAADCWSFSNTTYTLAASQRRRGNMSELSGSSKCQSTLIRVTKSITLVAYRDGVCSASTQRATRNSDRGQVASIVKALPYDARTLPHDPV